MSDLLEMKSHATASKTWYAVLLAEIRCVFGTLAMLTRNEITLPKGNVGRGVWFADGTRSEVYRETAIRHRQSHDLVVLVVRFRLRLIGVSRFWHYLFRVESFLNTLLFAAHRGFQTKLWLSDRQTGYYRGIYEWRDAANAIEYLETLRVVLAPWVQPASFAYEVLEGVSRDEYLDGDIPGIDIGSGAGWWCPVKSADDPTHD